MPQRELHQSIVFMPFLLASRFAFVPPPFSKASNKHDADPHDKSDRNFPVIFQHSQSLITHSKHVFSLLHSSPFFVSVSWRAFALLYHLHRILKIRREMDENKFCQWKMIRTHSHATEVGEGWRVDEYLFLWQIFCALHCLVYCLDSNVFIFIRPKIARIEFFLSVRKHKEEETERRCFGDGSEWCGCGWDCLCRCLIFCKPRVINLS